jgi:hypothetical protein
MSGTTKNLLIGLSFVVFFGSLAAAGYFIVGATVIASTGTLRGGWQGVSVDVGAVLVVGIGLAIVLFWVGARKPKSLRAEQD